MVSRLIPLLLFALCLRFSDAYSQNETNKWYFGNNAGLDFMTSPPTVLTNGAILTNEGCATISDAAGNLLFYTNGVTVFDKNHATMANGTGLNGDPSSSQSAIIAKQPGNPGIYYIFTQSGPFGAGAAYSVVDMNLAAGVGSVTVKNMMLSTPCTEKLTSVKHCNAIDIWVIYHGWGNAEFKSYLLTASGVNTTAVISSIGTIHSMGNNFVGCMKTSPNGKKLGLAIAGDGLFELFDFDNTSGIVSNSLSLNTSSIVGAYGCEFSPDGTKFYGTRCVSNPLGQLFQWDLCAGSPAAIAASLFTVVTTTNTAGIGALQKASNGKIYGARYAKNYLITINNPNVAGAGCNYVEMGISIAPKISLLSLPNFITSFDRSPSPPFTYTLNCATASFTARPLASGTSTSCQNATFSLSSLFWNFGDPASGSANTSTLNNPTHQFSGIGSFTTQLILYYSCSGGTDTIKQPVSIVNTAPSVSVSGNFTICSGEKRIYTASGASSYSWSTGPTSSTIAVSPTITTNYSVTGTGTNSCSDQETFTITVNKCSGIVESGSTAESVKIYPNPANSFLQIENLDRTFIVILDLSGSVLLKEEYEPGHHTLDLSKLEDGIYYVRSINPKETSFRRFIKAGE